MDLLERLYRTLEKWAVPAGRIRVRTVQVPCVPLWQTDLYLWVRAGRIVKWKTLH